MIFRPKHQITKAKRENDKIIFSKSFAFGSGLLLTLRRDVSLWAIFKEKEKP